MELIVPNKLSEVPYYKMQTYNALPSTLSDDERAMEALSIFCDLTKSEVSKLPYNVITRATESILKFLNEKPKLIPRFTLNNIEYGFVPNLDKISGGEIIDIDNYQKNPNDLWRVMSVLYRPIIISGQNNRYDIEPYKGEVNEDFKELTSDIVFGAMLFFWTLGADLMTSTRNYSLTKKKELATSMGLTKNGDGWDSFIYSLGVTSANLRKSVECPFTLFAYGHPTKLSLVKWNNAL